MLAIILVSIAQELPTINASIATLLSLSETSTLPITTATVLMGTWTQVPMSVCAQNAIGHVLPAKMQQQHALHAIPQKTVNQLEIPVPASLGSLTPCWWMAFAASVIILAWLVQEFPQLSVYHAIPPGGRCQADRVCAIPAVTITASYPNAFPVTHSAYNAQTNTVQVARHATPH